MKVRGLFFCLLATAGCAAARPDVRHSGAAWLPGSWLMMASRQDRDLTACSSGLPISYGRNGTYSLLEERGRWSLNGNILVETATEAHEDVVDPAEVAVGKPFRSRIRWLDRDSFIKIFQDDRQFVFRRCPDPR